MYGGDRSRRPGRAWRGGGLSGAAGLVTLACTVALDATAGAPGLRTFSDRPLPAEQRIVVDVRWTGDDVILLAAGRNGALRVRFLPDWGRPESVFSVSTGRSVWGASHLGVSGKYLAASPGAFAVSWKKLPDGVLETEAFQIVADLDVHEDRLLVLGGRFDEEGRFATDGAIAWIGSLGKGLRDLKPVRYSTDGPGAYSMGACGPYPLGGVRFLADGRFVVVPVVEPGAFLHDATGKLLRTWDTAALGIDVDCRKLKEEQMSHLLADLPAREAWLAQRRIVDDVLPLRQGPGLLVRRVEKGGTRWQLIVLKLDGTTSTVEVPFTCPSPKCHARADVRGDRIAFLLVDRDRASTLPSRLVVTSAP